MTSKFKSESFVLMGAAGYGLGAVASMGVLYSALSYLGLSGMSGWLVPFLGSGLMGLIGGLFLGYCFQERKKRIQFTLWSMFSGIVTAALLGCFILSGLRSDFIPYYLCISLAFGADLVAGGLMYVHNKDLERSAGFSLYGILAGGLGIAISFGIVYLFTYGFGEVNGSSLPLFFCGWGLFSGALLGLFFKRKIKNELSASEKS